jgi:hypothetical protein
MGTLEIGLALPQVAKSVIGLAQQYCSPKKQLNFQKINCDKKAKYQVDQSFSPS